MSTEELLMDLKETYDFLLSPRRLADEIWRKDIRRQELRACLLPSAITYDKDRVQTTPDDIMADTMADVVDLDAEIEILQRQRARQIKRIGKALDLLEDSREKAILEAYYIGQKSMNEIADRMNYSLQHTYRLKRDGVEKMRKMRKAYMV